MKMFLDLKSNQFCIKQIKSGLYVCSFSPNNRFMKSEYEIIVKKSHRFFDLVAVCDCDPTPNWWTMCMLANICIKYNGSYLT